MGSSEITMYVDWKVIDRRCDELDYSISDLAYHSKFDTDDLRKLKAERREVTLDQYVDLTNALELSPNELYAGGSPTGMGEKALKDEVLKYYKGYSSKQFKEFFKVIFHHKLNDKPNIKLAKKLSEKIKFKQDHSPIAGPLSVYIDSDAYTSDEKAELLSLISELYAIHTDDRLVIDNTGEASPAHAEVVGPDGGES